MRRLCRSDPSGMANDVRDWTTGSEGHGLRVFERTWIPNDNVSAIWNLESAIGNPSRVAARAASGVRGEIGLLVGSDHARNAAYLRHSAHPMMQPMTTKAKGKNHLSRNLCIGGPNLSAAVPPRVSRGGWV